MSEDSKLISVRNLNKVFSRNDVKTVALADISFDIWKGDYISITGPSGCGKSTLLSILGLLDKPSSGQYKITDIDVTSFNTEQLATIRNNEIGFIFQDFNLIGDLSVLENVELPLTYRKMAKAEIRTRAMECLRRVNMDHRANYYPTQLSGGQQQRVAVARALVGEPSLLLADEPTGNLDSSNGDAVMQLLQELNRDGVTICLITHDPKYAKHAKRVLQMKDGQIVLDQSQNVVAAINDDITECAEVQ